MRGLVEGCSAVLEGELDAEAAVERLMLADELGLAELRGACVRFLGLRSNLEAAQETESPGPSSHRLGIPFLSGTQIFDCLISYASNAYFFDDT